MKKTIPAPLALLLALGMLLLAAPQTVAQSMRRGPRTMVRAGRMDRPDTLRGMRDSLRHADLLAQFEAIADEGFADDSLRLYALRTDDITTLDSSARRNYDRFARGIDTTRRRSLRKGWFMNDSMSLSKVCWISTVLPGYGQVYNRQAWKLPILYGTVGTGLALFINENRTYRPLRRKFDAYTDFSLSRTPELNALQERMIRSNTRRQLYLGLTVASYVYFIGDAAVNYSTNDVSDVKKATTLACIFPGAGQIYNQSYWKVPFVVGGFAAMIYCIDWNNRGFQRFKKAYALRADYDAHPELYPNGSTDEFRGRYEANFLRNLRNNYRRNRDLCIIISGALYILQIVDAHVDAHLKDYDVTDDLSMNLEPLVDYTFVPSQGGSRPVFGFNMSLNF